MKNLNPFTINLFYIFAIGLNIVLLRYFSIHLDALNNNGVRFTAGGIALLIFVLAKYRQQFKQILTTPKLLTLALSVGIMMTANMYFYLKGVSTTNAITAAIFGVISMPFGILFAGVVFQDEREKLKSKQFWIGCVLTLVGSLSFIWSGNTIAIGDSFFLGAFFLLLSITIRNIQNLIVKFSNNKLNSFVLSCFTSLTAGIISLLFSQQSGNIGQLNTIPSWLLFSLILVGLYGIGTGMVLTFSVIQKQGIVTYQVLELILPISTAVIAYFLLGETISLTQIISAIAVIVGASIALRLFPFSRK